MATVDVCEFPEPLMAHGHNLPCRPLPLHVTTVDTTVASGVFTPASGDCYFISVLPSADMRMGFVTDGSAPPDPTAAITLGKLLKANVEKEFCPVGGWKNVKLRFA